MSKGSGSLPYRVGRGLTIVAKPRNWQALTPTYRKRLERGGITRSDYESGSKVTSARGHARTPERPERAAKNPARYPTYLANRKAEDGKTPSALLRQLAKFATRVDLDYGYVRDTISPSERANFLAGWQVAHAQYLQAHRVTGAPETAWARGRMDAVATFYPGSPRELGFYH